MEARVVTGQYPLPRIKEAIDRFSGAFAPILRQQPGCRNVRLAINGQTGRFVAVSLWEGSAERMAAEANPMVQSQIAKMNAICLEKPALDYFDVLFSLGLSNGRYTRVQTRDVRPDRLAEAVAILSEMAQSFESLPGWNGALIMAKRETGLVRLVTFWDTAESRAAFTAGPIPNESQARLAELTTRLPEPAEFYEVEIEL